MRQVCGVCWSPADSAVHNPARKAHHKFEPVDHYQVDDAAHRRIDDLEKRVAALEDLTRGHGMYR